MNTTNAATPPVKRPGVIRTPFYYGWLIVLVVVLSNFTQVGLFNPVLSVFMKPMADEFGWSRAEVAAGITIGSIGAAIVTPFLGPLLDRYGTRWALAGAQFVYGGCMILLGSVDSLPAFYAVFGGSRVFAIGVSNLAGTVLVANWFVRRRSRAVGLAVLGIRAGQGILPLVAQGFITWLGWRGAWMGIGLLVWAIAVLPSALFIRRRPEDVGLLPDGDTAESIAAQAKAVAAGTAQAHTEEVSWTLRQAMRTRALWMLTLANAQFALGIGAVNLHLVPYLTDNGIRPEVAVTVFTVQAASGAVGGVFWGAVAERWGIRWAMAAAFFLEALAALILLHPPDLFWGMLFAVAFGFNFGGLQTFSTVVFADYFGRRSTGAINGFATPPQLLCNAAGPIIAGMIYDTTGSYHAGFAMLAGSYLLGMVWMALAPRPSLPKAASVG
ncbi:MAG: MFS transporter [Chloroflexi bacterium]|nr:MFS transporter [Chloroflexota bacterium]